MNLFLDTSVILAACGSPVGASRAIFNAAADNGWSLLTSDYVLSEVAVNLPALPSDAAAQWARLRAELAKVPDVLTFEWATVFAPAKDRPSFSRPPPGQTCCSPWTGMISVTCWAVRSTAW